MPSINISTVILVGVVLCVLLILVRATRAYQKHLSIQEEQAQRTPGLEITLPASRQGVVITFPMALDALMVALFRLIILPYSRISSHIEAKKLFLTLIQARQSKDNEGDDTPWYEEMEEEENEEDLLPLPTTSAPTVKLTREMATQLFLEQQQRQKQPVVESTLSPTQSRSSFRSEESGRSIILPDLLRDDPRHFLIAAQGFVSQIHHLALANGGKVTRDPFSKNEGPQTYNQKITRKEWDLLVGSTNEPGWLRKARIIEERPDGSYWPYGEREFVDAWRKFEPFLLTCIEDVQRTYAHED